MVCTRMHKRASDSLVHRRVKTLRRAGPLPADVIDAFERLLDTRLIRAYREHLPIWESFEKEVDAGIRFPPEVERRASLHKALSRLGERPRADYIAILGALNEARKSVEQEAWLAGFSRYRRSFEKQRSSALTKLTAVREDLSDLAFPQSVRDSLEALRAAVATCEAPDPWLYPQHRERQRGRPRKDWRPQLDKALTALNVSQSTQRIFRSAAGLDYLAKQVDQPRR